jgi:hypothetical protein
MALFAEFFFFELKLRAKSLSTWVYFALWFTLSFLAIAAEDFISTGNGKQLLNGPYSTSVLYCVFMLFGAIVIAAIFGTSILRDFQRDTFQLVFTKPITKLAYLGGRWAGSFVTCVFVFSGMVFGEAADLFCRRGLVPPDDGGLSAGCRRPGALADRIRDLRCDAIAGTFLVGHPRSHRPADDGCDRALLDGSGKEFAALLLVAARGQRSLSV